jgi:hypothetical protein
MRDLPLTMRHMPPVEHMCRPVPAAWPRVSPNPCAGGIKFAYSWSGVMLAWRVVPPRLRPCVSPRGGASDGCLAKAVSLALQGVGFLFPARLSSSQDASPWRRQIARVALSWARTLSAPWRRGRPWESLRRVTPFRGRNGCEVHMHGEGGRESLLVATHNAITPLMVWGRHLHHVADAVVEALEVHTRPLHPLGRFRGRLAHVPLRLCCSQTTHHWHTGSSHTRVVEASSDRPVEASWKSWHRTWRYPVQCAGHESCKRVWQWIPGYLAEPAKFEAEYPPGGPGMQS